MSSVGYTLTGRNCIIAGRHPLSVTRHHSSHQSNGPPGLREPLLPWSKLICQAAPLVNPTVISESISNMNQSISNQLLQWSTNRLRNRRIKNYQTCMSVNQQINYIQTLYLHAPSCPIKTFDTNAMGSERHQPLRLVWFLSVTRILKVVSNTSTPYP